MTKAGLAQVSVIVTTHNRFAYMVEAVRSALVQTCPPLEICIVDDGSSPSVLSRWETESPLIAELPIRFVRIENLGPSAARNAGAANAKGAYLAFLDDDDQMMPSYIESATGVLTDGADVTVAWMRCFNNEREWPGKHIPVDHLNYDPYVRNVGFVGSNIVVARTVFEKLGGFDAALLGSEDKDFYIRLKKSDAKISVLSEELIRYRVHALEQASGTYRFHPFQVSGKQLFLKKHAAAMSRQVYAKLAADSGLFCLMGGKSLRERAGGLWSILRYNPGKLVTVAYVLMRRVRRVGNKS